MPEKELTKSEVICKEVTSKMEPIDFQGDLGHFIHAIMKEKGWSNNELARSAGVSDITVRRLVKGESNITLPKLYRICLALGVSMSDLIKKCEYEDE